MTRGSLRVALLGGGGMLLAALGGCVLAADLINPGFLTQLGLDPGTVIPPPGRVVVTFTNSTGQPAEMDAYFSEDPALSGGMVLSNIVPAGDSVARAIDCPFAFLAPGQLNEDLSVDTTAAVVDPDGQATQVAYEGAPLVLGVDLVCGDLVEVRLIETGAAAGGGGQATFELRVQVFPGR